MKITYKGYHLTALAATDGVQMAAVHGATGFVLFEDFDRATSSEINAIEKLQRVVKDSLPYGTRPT